MRVTHQKKDHYLIVKMEGSVAQPQLPEIKNRLDPLLLDASIHHFLIDLAQVNFIDSLGIGMFMGVCKTLTSRNAHLAFCEVSNTFRDLFHFVHLDVLATLYESEDDFIHGVTSQSA